MCVTTSFVIPVSKSSGNLKLSCVNTKVNAKKIKKWLLKMMLMSVEFRKYFVVYLMPNPKVPMYW